MPTEGKDDAAFGIWLRGNITTMRTAFTYDCAPRFVHSFALNESRSSGKERDTESGLDYFGARYYGSNMGRFMSPDWSAKAEPVPYSKLDNPQSLNLYSYTLNNPLSNVDTDGHACSGILGNTGSGFCTRATEYGMIDGNSTVRSQTRFFAAASAVSSALADVNAPGSSMVSGVSGQTASFLEGVGQKLQAFNEGEAHLIASGNLSGPGLDQQLVHNEQSMVQGSLDSLKQSSPDAYNQTISQINGALNPGTVAGAASNLFSTDKAYAGVLNGVRKDLGRNIDFSKQGDREAIGNALVNHVRQTGGCDVTGSKGSGCH
jgi:RHS repeat-associated protein